MKRCPVPKDLYYQPLPDHGSSLSPAVHAAITARIGLSEDAERYWKQSPWLDLANGWEPLLKLLSR